MGGAFPAKVARWDEKHEFCHIDFRSGLLAIAKDCVVARSLLVKNRFFDPYMTFDSCQKSTAKVITAKFMFPC